MGGCNCSVKKSSYMKEWMAQADPRKEVNTVKKWMTGCYLSLQIKRHTTLKNGRLQVVFWKKNYCLYKNLMLPIDSASSNWSQKLKAVNTPKVQLFGESQKSPLQVQIFTIALLKTLPYWITAIAVVKLSNWDISDMKEWDSYKCFWVFNTVNFLQKLLELVLWNK